MARHRHIRCHTPRRRGIQYAAASRSIISASGILDHPLSRMMTTECVVTDFQTADCLLTTQCARVLPDRSSLIEKRAQGMPGAGCARSLACKIKKHTSIVTTVTPETPGIPRAMVLTVSFVLFPVTGLVCHRH